MIECAVAGATAFERLCAVERTQAEGAPILVVRHPDGGFRRFEVISDGTGLATADGAEPAVFRFAPRDDALAVMIERLARAYEADLIGVTKLIHDRTQKSAQRFSEAFKWRKDS